MTFVYGYQQEHLQKQLWKLAKLPDVENNSWIILVDLNELFSRCETVSMSRGNSSRYMNL